MLKFLFNLFKKEKPKEPEVDLQHVYFDKDGVVHLALHRPETQKAIWDKMRKEYG